MAKRRRFGRLVNVNPMVNRFSPSCHKRNRRRHLKPDVEQLEDRSPPSDMFLPFVLGGAQWSAAAGGYNAPPRHALPTAITSSGFSRGMFSPGARIEFSRSLVFERVTSSPTKPTQEATAERVADLSRDTRVGEDPVFSSHSSALHIDLSAKLGVDLNPFDAPTSRDEAQPVSQGTRSAAGDMVSGGRVGDPGPLASTSGPQDTVAPTGSTMPVSRVSPSIASGLVGAASDGADRLAQLLVERIDNPLMAPAVEVTSPALRVEHNGFVSVQVNVNSLGNNIVGDAANEPSIAVDPTDPSKMAIGWRQFNTIQSSFRQAGVGFTQDGGESWTFPGVLQPGQFRSDPVLGSNAQGVFYYYSLSSTESAELFRSTNGGVTWTGPIPAFGGDKTWMAIDKTGGIGEGNIYATWQRFFSCCDEDIFTRSINGGDSFQQPVPVAESPLFGTIDVGPDGEVYVAGLRGVDFQDFNTFVIARSSNAQDTAQIPFFEHGTIVDMGGSMPFGTGPNPGGLLGQVWVATNHSSGPSRGNVYMLAPVNPPGSDPMDVMFARSTDGGETWSDPIRVNDDAGTNAWQWFGTMSVAPNGRIDVIWNDTRNTGQDNMSQTFLAYSVDGGDTWSENVAMTPVWNSYLGWPNQQKIGDYYHMVSDDNGAHLAFSATFNGEQDVYYIHMAPDCNSNGVHDGSDLIDGTSRDINDNLKPDECEPARWKRDLLT